MNIIKGYSIKQKKKCLLVLERRFLHWHGRTRSLLQTRKRLLHSTAENSDVNMACFAFEPVRDMPVLSDCHPMEGDKFQAPAPPSDRVGVTGVRVGAAGNSSCLPF